MAKTKRRDKSRVVLRTGESQTVHIIIVGRMQIAKGVMYMPRHSMSFATKRSRLKKIKKTA